jgi:uncharacterized protein YhfF
VDGPLPDAATLVAQLAARGITLPPGPVRVGAYGDSAALSASLLAQIRAGTKRAGTALLWALQAEGETPSQAGDLEIVVDHRNRPVLVTRDLRVAVVPFDQVDARYAAVEGEGDGSLAWWRDAHWAFFGRECARLGRECARLGREPSPDMPVVCCEFELLLVIPED